MSETRIAAKNNEAKKENSVPQQHKTELSQPMRSPADRILFLQRTAGNQAVQRLLKSGALQAKLRIGAPSDVYEQEADRVAEQVVSSAPIQRKCTSCDKDIEEKHFVQRKVENTSAAASVPDSFIQNLGAGQPLDPATRAFFEPRFGQDFGGVRVYTDARAAEASRGVDARAFTVGRDVVFGEGEYAEGMNGQRLMAHELTHVVQQSHSDESPFNQINENCRLFTISALNSVKLYRDTKDNETNNEVVQTGIASNKSISTAEDSTEAFELNLAQRGFDFVGDLHKRIKKDNDALVELNSNKAVTTDKIKLAKLDKKIKEVEARLASNKWKLVLVSKPQLKDSKALSKERDELVNKIGEKLTPAQKERAEKKLATLNKQIEAVEYAQANPNKAAPLAAFEGTALGSAKLNTFVMIEVHTADGKIHTFRAKNVPGFDHAEDVIAKQIVDSGLADKNGLLGAKMFIFGDQEVCPRCQKRLPEFAVKYGIYAIEGYTTHAPALTNDGSVDKGKKVVGAKTTSVGSSNPAQIDKREAAQRKYGVIKNEEKLKLQQLKSFLWYHPDIPTGVAKPSTIERVSVKVPAPLWKINPLPKKALVFVGQAPSITSKGGSNQQTIPITKLSETQSETNLNIPRFSSWGESATPMTKNYTIAETPSSFMEWKYIKKPYETMDRPSSEPSPSIERFKYIKKPYETKIEQAEPSNAELLEFIEKPYGTNRLAPERSSTLSGEPITISYGVEQVGRIGSEISKEPISAKATSEQSNPEFQFEKTGIKETFDPYLGSKAIRMNIKTGVIDKTDIYIPVLKRQKNETMESMGSLRSSGGQKVIGGAAGAIAVANEILDPYSKIHTHQTHIIQQAKDEIAFWKGILGNDPIEGMWNDKTRRESTEKESSTGVGVFSDFVFPYIKDLDLQDFRKKLLSACRYYPELIAFLEKGSALGSIYQDSNKTYVRLNWVSQPKIYDITEDLIYVTNVLIDRKKEEINEKFQGISREVFRLKEDARLYVDPYNDMPIENAGKRTGMHPLFIKDEVKEGIWGAVKSTVKNLHLNFGSFAKVRPVNIDAYQAIAYSKFKINETLEDYHTKLKNRGFKVDPEFLSFHAEEFKARSQNDEDQFREIRCLRDPDMRGSRTIAIGELKYCWVKNDALEINDGSADK